MVEYLYDQKIPLLILGERRAMDKVTKREFDEYLQTYGRE